MKKRQENQGECLWVVVGDVLGEVLHGSPDFFTLRNDFAGREEETVSTSVTELKGVTPGNIAGATVEPVRGSSSGDVEIDGLLGSVGLSVDGEDGIAHSVTKSLKFGFIGGVGTSVSIGAKDELGVGVEVDGGDNVALGQEVLAESLGFGLREGSSSVVGVGAG